MAVLEGVEKPGNVGAVLRSADRAGVSALIVAEGEPISTIRTRFEPAWERSSRCRFARRRRLPCAIGFASQRIPIFAARVDAATDYTAVDFTGPAAIVLGSEAAGLS